MTGTPFFSIGVTTYRRRDFLRQCLQSICRQTFSDFEVIVGNDFTGEVLSLADLGVTDSRVQILNNPENLGELSNMNSLLRHSTGRYFAWVADDDMFALNYLEAAHHALARFGFPPAVFSSFRLINHSDSPLESVAMDDQHSRILGGPVILRESIANRMKVISTMGFVEATQLREIGGLTDICGSRVALYTEYLHLVRLGLLEKVAYVDAPLVFFRAHEGSWGPSNRDADLYRVAAENLMRLSLPFLAHANVRADFSPNFSALLRLVTLNFIARSSDAGRPLTACQLRELFERYRDQLGSVTDEVLRMEGLRIIRRVRRAMRWPWLRAHLRALSPHWAVAGVRAVRRTLRHT